MYRIRRFGVVKTATVVAVIYMLMIAIFFVPIAILVVVVDRGDAAAPAGVLAIGLVAAILYGVLGWIVTAIACALYNVAAGWTGGIEVQVESVAPPAPVPLWGPSGTPTAPSAPPAR